MVRKIVLSLILIITAIFLIATLLGYRPFIVRSSSMEPAFRNGDLVIADTRSAFTDLSVGAVIVYRSSSTLELGRYQGDGTVKADNSDAVETISDSSFIGKEIVTIPWIGNAVGVFLQNRLMIWILIAALFIYSITPRKLINRFRREREDS